MPPASATHTRAPSDPSPSAPAPPDPTPLPRPDTLDPDLYLVLAHHVGGDPELHLALAQMVQTLAWCHGRPYPSTALTGTIDETGRHWIRATARHWQATCPDLHRRIIDRCLKAIRPKLTFLPSPGVIPCGLLSGLTPPHASRAPPADGPISTADRNTEGSFHD